MPGQKVGMAVMVATALLVGALSGAMNRRLPVERLSADIVPFISDPNAAIVLAKVVSAKWSAGASRETQQGVVTLEILEVFHGPRPHPRETIEVHGERLADPQARFHSGINQWNILKFEQGELLLMALRLGTAPPPWHATAAQQVESLNDPSVSALRHAVEIEAMPPAARRPALGQALHSHEDLLRDYAADAIDRRRVEPREVGAGMLAGAAVAPDTTQASKIAFVRSLASRNFYRYELGADPVNLSVVRTIATLLVRSDAKHSPLWTQFLGSTIAIELSKDPAKDAEVRRALIRGVVDPPPDRVLNALGQQVAAGSQDPRAAKLLQYWRDASR